MNLIKKNPLFTKFAVVGILALGLASEAPGQDEQDDYRCDSTRTPLATDATSIQALASVSPNAHGDVQISMNLNDDSYVDQIFRFRPSNEAHIREILGFWGEEDQRIELRTWEINRQKLALVTFLDERGTAFSVSMMDDECHDAFSDLYRFQNADHYSATVIAMHTLATTQKLDHPSALSWFEEKPLIGSPAGSSADRGPMWCLAGGPPSEGCSWSAGGIGPITGGGCSIDCPPWAYACCGPGFGHNCECIPYDGTGGDIPPSLPPAPPPPGSGGGGGGCSGCGGGGGGGGGWGGGPEPPGDDDDDDPGDDSANSIDGGDG